MTTARTENEKSAGLDATAPAAAAQTGDGTSSGTGHGGPGREHTVEELKVLVEEAQQRFGTRGADTDEVLAWAAERFGQRLAVACSMASDTVVPAPVSNHLKNVDVLFLETGHHFPEPCRSGTSSRRSGP